MLAQATFDPLDWGVMCVYMLATFGIATWSSRRQSTEADYFLAGRSIHPAIAGISLLATLVSTVSFVGVPGEAYRHGVLLLLGSVGYAIVTPLAIRYFLPFFYGRGESTTLYQYLEERFDWRVRALASTAFLIGRTLFGATVCYAGAKLFHAMADWPQGWTIFGMALFTTIYTTVGGMKGVLRTDVMQTVVMLLGIALIWYYLSSLVGHDYAAVWNYANEHGHGFTRITDPEFYQLDIYDRYTFWAIFLIYSILRPFQDYGSDQLVVQRLLSAGSYQKAKRAAYLKAAMSVPMMALLYGLGILLFYYYNHNATLPVDLKADKVLPHFVTSTLPAPIPGLLAAAMLAALMSTISSVISSLATVSSVDLLQRGGWYTQNERSKIAAGRLLSFIWGGIILLVALGIAALETESGHGNPIMEVSQVILSLAGVLLVIVLVGTRTKWGTANAATVALALGMIVGIIVPYRFYFLVPDGEPRISFLWLGVPGIVVTLVVIAVASALEHASRRNARHD